MNEAGKELLSFLSGNEATTCNTRFKKSDMHEQHPKSKKWHSIDYVMIKVGSRLEGDT